MSTPWGILLGSLLAAGAQSSQRPPDEAAALQALAAWNAPSALDASAAQKSDTGAAAQAPDGRRGFGAGLTQRDLGELLHSKEEADREFLGQLTQLAMAARVLLLEARQSYVARGYFHLLPASVGDDLAALHAAYARVRDEPSASLAGADAAARTLAALLVDTKFNVRRDLLDRAVSAAEDLERARAVFGATIVGYVTLVPAEFDHVAARADLAAAELRTLRSDLEALRPDLAPPSADELAWADRLLEAATAKDARARSAAVAALLAPRRELEARMQSLLFAAAAEPKLAPLRQWRQRSLDSAAGFRVRALEALPDTTEGEHASKTILQMKKSDRMGLAYELAVQGLANDPLDPVLAWAAGHARQFSWPGLEGIAYFDRFLALSDVRTSDPRPGNGRKLTPREQEAFSAVASFQR